VGIRISDISENLYVHLIEQLRTLRFALQVEKETDVVKNAYVITCVRYRLENDMKEVFCFANHLMVELCYWKYPI
jgi:hypothetical protein